MDVVVEIAGNFDQPGAVPISRRPIWIELPSEIRNLAPREREVATSIYNDGPMTANEVLERLSKSISNGAVRSMLNRLVAKQILARRLELGGRFVYFPAISSNDAIERAFRRFVDDYFEGSLQQALTTIGSIVRRQ